MSPIERKQAVLRIGELERRTGVPTGTLRAWERRYAVLDPQRTDAGYRLYSEADVERVQRIRRLLDDGLSISEAARLVRSGISPDDAPADDGGRLSPEAFTDALVRFDGAAAQSILDDLTARFSVSSVAVRVVLPALRTIGEQQANGALGIGHEHFASNLIRGRFWGLTRTWDQGGGARAVLACAPGDHHDLGLLIFGIALRERGWRITYLGVDTPAAVLLDIVEQLDARAAVVSFTRSVRSVPDAEVFRQVAARAAFAIGGRAATAERAARLDAILLAGDPVEASGHERFSRP